MFTQPTGDGATGEVSGSDQCSARSDLAMPEVTLTPLVFDLTAQGGTLPESGHPFITDDCSPILGGLVVTIDGIEYFIQHVQSDVACLLERERTSGALKLEDCRQATFSNMIWAHFTDWRAVSCSLIVLGIGTFLYLDKGGHGRWLECWLRTKEPETNVMAKE